MNEGVVDSGHGTTNSVATLVHSLPVRVIEISGGGCRVEAPRALFQGTAGQLRVTIGGVVHFDDFRIARCQLIAGSRAAYQLGLELLNTRRLTHCSLRLAVRRLFDSGPARGLPVHEDDLPAAVQPCDERRKGVGRAPPERAAALD